MVAIWRAPGIALWLAKGRLARAGVVVTVRRATLAPWGALDVEGLDVRMDRPELGRSVHVAVPRARIALGLGVRRLVIRHATVEQPEVAISWEPAAARAAAPTARRDELPVSVGALSIAGARFVYQSVTTGPLDLDANDISITGHSEGADIALEVTSGPAALASPRGRDEARALAGDVVLDAGGVTIRSARLTHGSGELKVAGRVAISRGIALAIEGTADMADLLGQGLAGPATARRITGPVRLRAHLAGRIGGETLLLGSAWPAGPRRAIGLDVFGTVEQVALAEGGVGVALAGPEPGALAVAFGGGGAPTTYGGVLEADRDLAEIGQAFHLALPFEGRAVGTLQVSGAGPSFRLAGDVFSGELRREGLALGPVAGSVMVDAESFQLHADLETPRLQAGVDVATCFGSGQVAVDTVVARADADDVGRLLGIELPLQGTISGRASSTVGPAGAIVARGDVRSAAPRLRGVTMGPTQARFDVDGGLVEVDFAASEPTFARGSVVVREGIARIALGDASLPLPTALALAGLPALPYDALVEGSGTILAGPRPTASLELSVRGEIAGSLSVAGSGLACADLTTDDGVGARLDPSGDVVVRAPSLSALWGHVDLAGRAAGRAPLGAPPLRSGPVTFAGRLVLAPPSLSGSFRAAALVAPGLTLDALEGEIALSEGELRIANASGRSGEGRIAGELAFTPAGTRLRVQAVALPVTPYEGAATLVGGALDVSEERASGEIEARMGAARARARLGGEEPGRSAEIDVEGWPLPLAGGRLDARLQARLDGEGSLGGGGSFAISAAPERGLPGILGTLTAEGGRILLEAQDQTGAAVFHGRAELAPPGASGPSWELEAVMRDLRPSPRLVASVVETLPVTLAGPVEATLSGRLHVAGTAAQPVSFDVRLDDGALRVGGRDVISRAAGHLAGTPEKIVVERLELAGPELQVLGADGGAGKGPTLEARVDLALLGAIVEGVRAGGTLTGSWDDETGSVRLELADGLLGHRDLPWTMGAVRGTARASRAGIDVDRIAGTLGDGTFRVRGGWGEGKEIRINVTPVALPTRREIFPGLRGRMGGAITIRQEEGADGARTVIGGQVTLHDGRYAADLDLAALAAGRGVGMIPRADTGPLIDLAIELDEPVVVKNNVLDGAVDGSLTLSGPLAAPRVSGRLALEDRARLILRGQRYEVERGVIEGADLAGGRYRAELQANATIRSYDVELVVSARADAAGPPVTKVAYTSSPALPEEDVQALIMFGTTADRLPAGAGRTFSGALLFAPLVRGIEGTSRWLLGVDRVRIEPHASRTEDVATARVTVEKDIGRDLELIYSTSAGQDREDLIVIEYHGIPGNRRVTATREIDGSVSLDVGREVRFGRP